MKIAVTGPRSGVPGAFVRETLIPFAALATEILDGGAGGVDTIVHDWAIREGIPVRRFRAEWTRHGHAAGPLRNGAMLKSADALIAIRPDWPTKGTRSCIRMALQMGLMIYIRYYHGERRG